MHKLFTDFDGNRLILRKSGSSLMITCAENGTGLLDSNGKEIYEGDILRFAPPLRWEDNERRVGVVVFKYYAFVVKYDDTSTGLFTLAANEAPYTVIGNVHDNPDLLKRGEN